MVVYYFKIIKIVRPPPAPKSAVNICVINSLNLQKCLPIIRDYVLFSFLKRQKQLNRG